MEEISRLQHALDRANESIDDKIGKLEKQNSGSVDLTRKLEDARQHISTIEYELSMVKKQSERQAARLRHARCPKCHASIDLSLKSDAATRYDG